MGCARGAEASAACAYAAHYLPSVNIRFPLIDSDLGGGHVVCEDLGLKHWEPRYLQRFF